MGKKLGLGKLRARPVIKQNDIIFLAPADRHSRREVTNYCELATGLNSCAPFGYESTCSSRS